VQRQKSRILEEHQEKAVTFLRSCP
jgi:hypothetical protein